MASYPQDEPVGIGPPRLENGLRRLEGVLSLPLSKSGISSKLDYDVGVLLHDYSGSSIRRSIGNRMGWDNPMLFEFESDLLDVK